MKKPSWLLPCLLGLSAVARADYAASWIDPDTGHRVVQLSREAGTESLYFTQNAYTKDGKLIVSTPHGLATIDVNTGVIDPIPEPQTPAAAPAPDAAQATGYARFRNRARLIQTGRLTGSIFYQKGNAIYATDPVTKATKQVASLPTDKGGMASVATVNADETLVAGSITIGEERGGGARRAPGAEPGAANYMGGDNRPDKGAMMERRLAARLPEIIFTVNTRTGEYRELFRTTDWTNHFQFSPSDANLLMFAHEGPWQKVDRIWLIRTDAPDAQPMLVHQRTMKMEIDGHEFWGASGEWLWYDLQTPISEVFWVAGYNVKSGQRIWYHLERDQWSVHFNVSPDGKLFSGDGGSAEKNVAHAKDGKWLYLFHPRLVDDKATRANGKDLVQIGTFDYERLVNLKQHDYVLEPNATFTPDLKWLVFRSNMNGNVQVYAVELAKATTASQLAEPDPRDRRPGDPLR